MHGFKITTSYFMGQSVKQSLVYIQDFTVSADDPRFSGAGPSTGTVPSTGLDKISLAFNDTYITFSSCS